MGRTKIEWTESTWNPLTGCSKVSLGCSNCYAERLTYRLKAMGQPNYKNGFNISLHPHVLDTPLSWKKPRNIFVCSMSDIFHKEVPNEYIFKIFEVMKKASWHQFQILTKRSERLQKLNDLIGWPENVWIGVTIEHVNYKFRIEHIRNTRAKIKFLSLEPLLGPLNNINLNGIDWVIVGGESGPRARPMDKRWVLDIQQQCHKANVPFFFKQWGGKNKKKSGSLLNGRTWNEFPEKLLHISQTYSRNRI